ncbi:hypothetical protein [Actinobacillus porcinus]|uniref:hypothetical protein n=1 Tax=Actinobacillus porcinus TaxID=51048 RepID=UPI002A91226A|nr:hypothetical protein [Actinobacillus porcinus]MDY6216691.1 hypothetical protein [Actinobacillus porcinus]
MTDLTFSILMTLSICFGLSAVALFITPLLETLEQAKTTYYAALMITGLGIFIAFSHWLHAVFLG